MRVLYFLLAQFFCFGLVVAQNTSYEWGKLTQAEFDMTEYPKDPEAEAVVLFDIGLTEFIDWNNSFGIQFTRTRRIKILDQAGIDYAEFSIPYYYEKGGETEIIRSIEAVSYNYENSKLTKKQLDPESIYEEVINEHWKRKKIVIPDVKEGTVLEYKYVVTSPFHFNLPDWKFQDKIPTVYSSYTAKMIPFYEYIFIVQGTNKFSYQHSEVEKGLGRQFGSLKFNDMVHTYVMKDVPAFRDESYMTSIEDYIMKMDFQLAKFTSTRGTTTEVISTWDKLKDTYLKHTNFGKYVKKGQKTAESIFESELDLRDLNDEEKVEHIVNYVKNTITWNGYNAKFASKSCKELMKVKTGNAADINLFLTSMLQAAGIKATPMIISTRRNGKIDVDYPFSHYFNYVIVLVEVDGTSIVTDATERNLSYNRIPVRCMNEKGLLINDEDPQWINLNSLFMSKSIYNIDIEVNPEEDVFSTSVLRQATEYESYSMKERFENDSVKYADYLLDHGYQSISELKFKNYEHPDKKYFNTVTGDFEMEKLEDNLVIRPFLNIPPQENRLTQKKRTYPVDFVYPYTVKLTSKITIPENYVLVDQPDKIKIDNSTGTVILQYTQADNILTLEGEYAFKQGVYKSKQYDKVKFYMKNIVKIFNSPIVLKKKEELN